MLTNQLGNAFVKLWGSLGARAEGNPNFSAESGRFLRKMASKTEPEMERKAKKITIKGR